MTKPKHKVMVVGTAQSSALMVAAISAMLADVDLAGSMPPPQPTLPKLSLHPDEAALAKAQAKRDRKAAKRLANWRK